MLIYRGQNNNVDSFQISKGNDMMMSEGGIGLYFFDFKHRSRAYVYSLFNHESLLDDELDEQLDSGYFYECELTSGNDRPLNNVDMSELSNIGEWVSAVMKSGKFDVDFAENYGTNSIKEAISEFIDDLNESENAFEAIQYMFEVMKPECKQSFLKSLSPFLNELNSSYAISGEHEGEIIILNPEAVKINRKIEVTKEDLQRTREERIALTRGGVD